MLISEMVSSVKENLGGRASGIIGGTPVDTVVLAGINKGFIQIIKLADPEYYNRFASITLDIGEHIYDVPTVDDEGNPITIKQILSVRLSRTGEQTAYGCAQITSQNYMSARRPSAEETGIPNLFLYQNKKLLFTKYPDESWLFQMNLRVKPIPFTSDKANTTEIPVDDIWEETIESYATYYCFMKLQQMAEAGVWFANYSDTKRENKAVINKQPKMVHPNSLDGLPTDPLTDPFVRRWN
jgi:hypothetical protein